LNGRRTPKCRSFSWRPRTNRRRCAITQRNRSAPRLVDPMTSTELAACRKMTRDLGAYYGEHRRADAQASCDSAGSSNTGHHRTEPLLITGDKTRDAALGEPRIRAGEIIGWRIWRLCNGLLHSAVVSYTWHPGYLSDQASCIQTKRAGRARGALARLQLACRYWLRRHVGRNHRTSTRLAV
jgi:hypothetical protein